MKSSYKEFSSYKTYNDFSQGAYVFEVDFQDGSKATIPVLGGNAYAFGGEYDPEDHKTAKESMDKKLHSFEVNTKSLILDRLKEDFHSHPSATKKSSTSETVKRERDGWVYKWEHIASHSALDSHETKEFRNLAELFVLVLHDNTRYYEDQPVACATNEITNLVDS